MKKVLMVAYFWPPDNAAGTHRPLRFARHLREFDWEPVILTAQPIWYTRYDPNLLNRVPEGINVIRAPHRDLWLSFQYLRANRINKQSTQKKNKTGDTSENSVGNIFNWKGLARSFVQWMEPRIYHPDYFMSWIRSAIATAEEGFRGGKDITAIWATGNPWTDFEVGYQLSLRWNLPLILDFRDGWTLITYSSFDRNRPSWAKKWDHRRLSRYFQQSSAVVFLTDHYAEKYLAAYGHFLDAKKIHIIPNGFEMEPVEYFPEKGENLTMLYTGLLAQRKYDTLFSALANLLSLGKVENINLIFVGADDADAPRLASKLDLSEHVLFLPALPFETVKNMMKQAHVLLLLGEDPMPGMELFIASKLFHYWSMGRPVLGVLPDNQTRKIMFNMGSDLVADVNSIEQIENVLLELYRDWNAEALEEKAIPFEKIKKYSEPNLSWMLAEALEGNRF